MDAQLVPKHPLEGLKLTIRREGRWLVSDKIALDGMLVHTSPSGWHTALSHHDIVEFLRQEFAKATGRPLDEVEGITNFPSFFEDDSFLGPWYWCRTRA